MRGPNVEFAVTHSHMTGHSRQPDRHFYGIGEERRERRGGVALQQPRVVVPFQRPKLGAAPRSNICCAESLYTVRPRPRPALLNRVTLKGNQFGSDF